MGATFSLDKRGVDFKDIFYAYIDGISVQFTQNNIPDKNGYQTLLTSVKCFDVNILHRVKKFLEEKHNYVFFKKDKGFKQCSIDKTSYKTIDDLRSAYPKTTTFCKEIYNGFTIPRHISLEYCEKMFQPTNEEKTQESVPSQKLIDETIDKETVEETVEEIVDDETVDEKSIEKENPLDDGKINHPGASIKIDGKHAIYTPDGNGGLGTITIKNIGYAIYYTMYPVKNGNILCACVSINGIHCHVVF